MRKLISIIAGVFSLIFGVIWVYILGKKKGFEKALDDQIKKDNKNLSDEIKNVEKIKEIETVTSLASDDDAINGLRKWVSKDDSK